MKAFIASALVAAVALAAGCQNTHVWGQKSSGSPIRAGVNVNVPLGGAK